MLSTCNELWHFIDALNYVAEPLAYDELPAIAVINVHPGAILAGLRIFQICAEIEAVSHDENEARAVTVSIMLRQLAKHTLRRTSDSLYPLFNEAWSTLRDCFYRNYGGAKEDDIADPIIEGRPRTACLTADTVTNVHLLSAHDRARNALGDVNIRARLILNDLRAWITDIYRDVGGDIDMLAPLETPSCRQILAGLLADYM